MSTVMIAEDDLLMADMLEEVLVANGYEVCGIARTVEEGSNSVTAASLILLSWIYG